MFPGLFEKLAPINDDIYRNIKSLREPQDLYDDLSPSKKAWSFAQAAEARIKPGSTEPLITRPFDYGTVISYPFIPTNWHTTRFSDGKLFGVWYGSFKLETTVHETVYHWVQFVNDSYPDHREEIRSERRVFRVRAASLVVDIRTKHKEFPRLLHPHDYTFAQQAGSYLYDQGQNGLLVKSARYDGINADFFTPNVLSNPRDVCFLCYRYKPTDPVVVVERKPGVTWRRVTLEV